MEAIYDVLSWGSPLGISLFFFFSGIGAGVFFWGISRLPKSDKKDEGKKV